MAMRKLNYIALFLMSCTLWSCSNDTVEPSNLTLLTNNDSKSWRVSEYKLNGEINTTDCESDDIWTFVLFDESKNGQPGFVIEDNFIACNQDYSVEGIWRINNKGNRITLTVPLDVSVSDGFNVNLVLEIIELSDSKLVIKQFQEDLYGFKIDVLEYTFLTY
jgi:hypothetical protein